MTICSKPIHFSNSTNRKVEANFSAGNVTSDGGIMLIREMDNRLGLTKKLSQVIEDSRHPSYISHSHESLLRQRIYALSAGYEDLNDHEILRKDIAFQTAVGNDGSLGSASTLCRLEQAATRETAVKMHQVIVEEFIRSYKQPPEELILDFDPTDDPIHGEQEDRFYHGYYGCYCYLPLYVFCNDQLLVSYLRRSNIDGARHAWAILALLVKRFRQEWPHVKIIFRADSGFCRHRLLRWCEKNGVFYVVGIPKNTVLLKASSSLRLLAEKRYNQTEKKQRFFGEMYYAAKTWKVKRRIIVKAEHLSKGANPRFIVTNLTNDSQWLYERLYCARGDMENRIKEQQYDLFSDRTSCQGFWSNQFRLLLSSIAYILLSKIRAVALHGTRLAKAQCGTIRLKLVKIGAVVTKNTRRVKLLLSSCCPIQDIFHLAAHRLNSG